MTPMRDTWLACSDHKMSFLFVIFISINSVLLRNPQRAFFSSSTTAEKHLCGQNVQFKFHVDCSGKYRQKPTCDSPMTRSSTSL